MKDYNGVSGKQRLASWNLTKKAIAEHLIPKPNKCQLCGKTTGRIDYHSETYRSPTENLFQICQRCHMRWHNRFRYPDSFCTFMSQDRNYEKINPEMKTALKEEHYQWCDGHLTR